MTINAKTLEVYEELGSISDELDALWGELFKINQEATLPVRMRINNIDKRILKIADVIDLSKSITRWNMREALFLLIILSIKLFRSPFFYLALIWYIIWRLLWGGKIEFRQDKDII